MFKDQKDLTEECGLEKRELKEISINLELKDYEY